MPLLHTIADAKELLDGYTNDNTTDDNLLTLLQGLIYNRLEAETGRLLESQERVKVFRRPTYTYLPLEGVPIATVAVLRTVYDGEGVPTALALTNNYHYYVNNHCVILTDSGINSNADYTITYTGGFTADSSDLLVLPAGAEGFRRAALLQLVHEFNTRQKPGAEVIDTTIGSVTNGGLVLLKEVKAICKFLRHPAREMVW